MSEPRWSELMDSMYDEEAWWDNKGAHPGINPAHFDPATAAPPTELKERKPSLTRTLSTKLQRTLTGRDMTAEQTGRRRLSRSQLSQLPSLGSPERRELSSSCLWDPVVWLDAYRSARSSEQRAALRQLVMDTTRQASLDEHYWVVAGKEGVTPRKVPLMTHAHTLENVAMFDYTGVADPGAQLREARYSGTAHFIYADVIDVGIFMKQDQKCDPIVLTFANPVEFGGKDVGGGISQEEYILRRTNIGNVVNNESGREIRRNWVYNLPACGGLYVPSALVIRSNEATGHKFLINPVRLSFILAAAPINECAFKVNKDASFVEDWRRRINAVLSIALQKGHDSLVLGAWGCGELGNNAQQVASLFRQELTHRFRGCFKHVVFSFLHDPDAFKAFCAEFGAPRMGFPEEVEVFNRKKRAAKGPNARTRIVVAKPLPPHQQQLQQQMQQEAAKKVTMSNVRMEVGPENEDIEVLDWTNM